MAGGRQMMDMKMGMEGDRHQTPPPLSLRRWPSVPGRTAQQVRWRADLKCRARIPWHSHRPRRARPPEKRFRGCFPFLQHRRVDVHAGSRTPWGLCDMTSGRGWTLRGAAVHLKRARCVRVRCRPLCCARGAELLRAGSALDQLMALWCCFTATLSLGQGPCLAQRTSVTLCGRISAEIQSTRRSGD